jgi:Ca2+-binding RTX toxin-like protein
MPSYYGSSAADTLAGTTGADQFFGFAGNDSLSGGAGNDDLYGDDGNDTLDGGEGNDHLYGDDGHNLLLGQAGNDYLSTYYYEGNSTLDGGEGNDTLYGGAGRNLLLGQAGNDYLSTYSDVGNSTLDGGTGNDSLYAEESSDDRLLGGSGNDYLDSGWSGLGNDTLDGGAGIDSLVGGYGNDVYFIDNVFDSIFEYGGNDTAYVSTSFINLPDSIENVIYTNGALAVPYWIDALLGDYGAYHPASHLGPAKTFGYAFPTAAPDYLSGTRYTDGYTAFSSIQIARTELALQYIESIIDVRFVQATNPVAPNVLSFASNTQTGSAGYAFYPSASFIGSDIFLNNASYNISLADGTYGALTLIHEVGHALGLKHPFDEPDAYGHIPDPPYLQGAEDDTAWSVMSYNDHAEQYYLRFSPLDIAALQYLYGVSPTSRATNDTYAVSSATANFIWDGDGIDSINASSLGQGATIYLTPGYWGYVGSSKATTITSAGQITVNFGTVIENLIGSGHADSLYGNASGNQILGGGGNDRIEGWDGDDSIEGGDGSDTITGGAFASSSGNVGADTLIGGAGNDMLVADGIGDFIQAGAGDDVILLGGTNQAAILALFGLPA